MRRLEVCALVDLPAGTARVVHDGPLTVAVESAQTFTVRVENGLVLVELES